MDEVFKKNEKGQTYRVPRIIIMSPQELPTPVTEKGLNFDISYITALFMQIYRYYQYFSFTLEYAEIKILPNDQNSN